MYNVDIWLRIDNVPSSEQRKIESYLREAMRELNEALQKEIGACVTWQVGSVPTPVVRHTMWTSANGMGKFESLRK